MQTVFMVAEKPSLAESIAKSLSNKRNSSRRGFNLACSIHEWTGQFMSEQVRFKMTSVCGHVMNVDFLSRYNSWDKVDPAELFVAPIEKKEANPKLKMVDFLRHEAKNAGTLILWLDCDKEGENICFEVINCVHSVMVHPKRILRAHFSAVTDQELHGAMKNLREPNKHEALSVDARQELDLRIGCAFTRFQTKFFQGKYGDLNSNLVSFGPCQTPTLGFCVKRHDQIQSFKPETFWRIKVSGVDDTGGVLDMSWNRDRIFDKEAASVFLSRVKASKTAEVIQVSVKQKIKPRPQGLNTVEMLRVASAGLGIGPHDAMAVAERLYTSGYINYPRTETTAYPNTFDLLHKKNFIMPDCCYEQTQVTVSIGEGELFTISGLRVVEPGFTRILTWQAVEDKSLPKALLNQGYQLALQEEPSLVEGQTGPPDYLTEAELITAMERHGIGTDASIPTHIENIVQRGYVQLLSGRKLQPTPLGIVLVHGYQAIDAELVLPHMRRAVEEQLNHIARGHAKYDLVLQFVLAIFAAKYRYFVEHIQGMDQLFEVSFTTLASSGKPLSRCGKCHRYLKFIDSRPQRLHCSICNETYTLPQNGTIRPYKTEKCPLDKFELLCWSQGGKGKNMVFCPYCYSHPPFESMQKLSGCNRCSHPTCPLSMESLGVDACPDCPYGILVLDDSNAPKYRLNCNRCPTFLSVSDTVKSMSVKNVSCSICTAMHLNLKFDPGKVPNSSGDSSEKINTTFSGCAFCTESLCSLFTIVRKKEPTNNPNVNLRGSRHRSGTNQRGSRRGRSFR
ncbi:DNA topoisomerase 3-beta-1 [Schistosoma japonicum]|nr:DNA topoisomerase 3-beta-1 [Schistosoma japonicum]KAH8877920.1 DNA topoisomerase 3-beta-1 [Schistosoma japonicum]